MTQHQLLQFLLPILIILPLLYFRMRKLTKARPLKLDRLWIRPALVLAIAALVLFVPLAAGQPMQVLMPLDWARLGLAGALGAAAGWQWGRTMAIEVHPEDGTLMVRGGQAAILLLAALILFRMGLQRQGWQRKPGPEISTCYWSRTFRSSFPPCCSPCAVWRCICGPSG